MTTVSAVACRRARDMIQFLEDCPEEVTNEDIIGLLKELVDCIEVEAEVNK